MNPLQQASIFILETILGIFIIALILRFLLQLFRANFRNQICQIITKVTNPIVIPLRKIIPGFFKLDMATLVAIFILTTIKVFAVYFLQGALLNFTPGLILYILGDVLNSAIQIGIVAIIAQAIMSWFSPSPYHPGVEFVHAIAEPINRPARRLLPSFSGIDFSPIISIMGLYLIQILVVSPLMGRSFY